MGARADDMLAFVKRCAGRSPSGFGPLIALELVEATCRRADLRDDMAGFAALARLVKAGKLIRVDVGLGGRSMDEVMLPGDPALTEEAAPWERH